MAAAQLNDLEPVAASEVYEVALCKVKPQPQPKAKHSHRWEKQFISPFPLGQPYYVQLRVTPNSECNTHLTACLLVGLPI